MAKWRCTVCNYIYDEEKKGVRFDDLSSDWICPICAAPKSAFVLMSSMGVEEDVFATTVADKIVEQLAVFGVEYVFGIPGDSILPLVDSLSRQDDIKFILTRHEETAAFMASAYAKLTSKLGVCLSIAGPGATNLITGLVDAATDRAPVLALLGQVAQVHLGSESLQEIDEIEIFAPFTVFHETISKPAQAINLTVLAVKNAYLKQGVSALSLPTDVLSETLKDTIWKPEEHLFQQKTAPPKNVVEKAIKLIQKSRKPFIFGGWGIRDCGAVVLQLAEKISAPIATTTRAKGVIPESHPLAVGVLGSVGTRFAVKAINNADLVIVIGSGFRQRNLLPKLPIIQIDVDGVKLGKSFPISCGLIGDARTTVQMILDKVSQKEPDEGYLKEITKLKEENRREITKEALDRSVPIHPGFVIQTLKKHTKKDAIITVDSGDHTYWFYKKYICDEERTLLSSNMASMAFALPAALAAQLAYPHKQVIAVNGDGGFGMLMADFTTAVQNNLPVKVIVFNDSMLKNIAKEQRLYGYPEFGTHFVNPDFAAFASSCGGEGYRVETPEELETALKQAFASEKPALIDIIIDTEKMAPITKTAEEN